MRLTRRSVFLAAASGIAFLHPGLGRGAGDAVTVSLGTATAGGGFELYGRALAASVAEADPGLVVEARGTRGSAENLPLLEAGSLDLGLVQGEAADEAWSRASGGGLRVLAAMYATAGLFVARADSPHRTLADLRGRRVSLGAAGSGLVTLGRYVLAGVGIDPDRDLEAITLERAGDGPAMVLDGRIAALWGGGIGWPGFLAVATAPGGARFIAPSEAEIARIRARHPALSRIEVPAGTYPGQGEALASVGSFSLILARPGFDDDVAYRLARALHRGAAAFAARLPQASDTRPENTVEAVPAERLHPGAARYLREAGLLRE